MGSELTGPAPAKVNLVLEVTGRRADGYHEIDTVLQTLALADTVALGPGEVPVTVSGPFAKGTPADESNLAWRALETLAKLVGRTAEGLAVKLDKQIPPAGGLGGGASDAATVLRLLQRAWPGTTDAALLEAAAAVGSDEPALVLGGTVRATGRGEVVRPLPHLAAHGVVLLVPRDTLDRKTARMFSALGQLPFDRGTVAEAFAHRANEPFTGIDVYNAFERVAFDLFSELATLSEAAEAAAGEPLRLAGAGPTLFWIGPPGEAARVAAACAALPCTVIETATAGSLWRP